MNDREYCQQGSVLMRTYSGDMRVFDGKLIEDVLWDDYNDCPVEGTNELKINYCPTCGNELKEEE